MNQDPSSKSPSLLRKAGTTVIVEDQRLVAEFLQLHCQSLGLEVVANCATLTEGIKAIQRLRPHLVLLDFSLPDGNGLEAAKNLILAERDLRVIGISSHRDPWTMLQVQRMGLHGFVDKNDQRPDVLTTAITNVLEGRVYYTQIVADSTAELRRDPNAFFRILSEYELKILSMIGRSMTDAEIGVALDISPATVQSRRRDIMRKLDVHSTPKLIHYAITNGLTRPEQLQR